MKMIKGFSVVSACFFMLFFSVTVGYSYTIDASAGPGGSISPSGQVTVAPGADQTFSISTDPYYSVSDVLVDGAFMGAVSSYTFTNVNADHTIGAFFGCTNPIKLEWNDSYYNSIMGAYDYASINLGLGDFTLMLTGETLSEEDLYFDQDVSVFLDGGYDCSFLDYSVMTKIPGTLTVSAGVAIPSKIVLSAPLLCQSGDPDNFPGNPEICDGLDNDCDGVADNGLNFDNDGDGYTSIGSCECGGSADDCNDNNASIHPGAFDTPADGIDQDCNGYDMNFTAELIECSGCHGTVTGNYDLHTNFPTPNNSCAGCHSVLVSNIIVGHYGREVRTAGNNMSVGSIIDCWSCHDYHNQDYEIDSPYVVWKKVWEATSLNCDTCHEDRAAMHATDAAHDNRLIDSTCENCHTSDTTVLGSPGTGTLITDADVDILHHSDCTLCHAYQGTKLCMATVKQAIEDGMNGTDITCLTCHGATFVTIHSEIANHSALVNVGATLCADCHSDPPPLVDPTDPRVHYGCDSCHNPDFSRRGIAIGHTFDEGGDCTTCHGDHFLNHTHHNGVYNDLRYNPAVDTSQSTQQGCAVCHHDYDFVNGTNLGLNTWQTILVEHDLDGTKDGSTNTCDNCHAYDGSSSAPLFDVQDAIASGNQVTCATCHTDKTPDVSHSIPTSGKHPEHFDMANILCETCHNILNYPYFKSGTDSNGDGLYNLTETDVCELCHQDGSGTPAADDYKGGWYDPDFVLACDSCHGIAPSSGSHAGHSGAHADGYPGPVVYGDLRITEDFAAGQPSSVTLLGCGNCHPLDKAYHGNQVWGDMELVNAAAPADSLKALSPNGSYDQGTDTCSNVYCHSKNSWTTDGAVPMPWPDATMIWHEGVDPLPRPLPDNIVKTRIYHDVTWGAIILCNGCHAVPPQTTAADNDGGAGDSHYWVDSYGFANLHLNNLGFGAIDCRTCHYDTIRAPGGITTVGLYDKRKHINGSVDVAFDTVNNYTYYTSAYPMGVPMDLSLASFNQATKTCGNVECHIEETEVIWGLPFRWEDSMECDRCHGYDTSCSDCHVP
jgi:predicted CxxxxCH...CXXCH cytochrome family protein